MLPAPEEENITYLLVSFVLRRETLKTMSKAYRKTIGQELSSLEMPGFFKKTKGDKVTFSWIIELMLLDKLDIDCFSKHKQKQTISTQR